MESENAAFDFALNWLCDNSLHTLGPGFFNHKVVIATPAQLFQGFPGGSVVENLPDNIGAAGDTGSVPGWQDPLGEEMATHPSILVWRIPWTEEPGGL